MNEHRSLRQSCIKKGSSLRVLAGVPPLNTASCTAVCMVLMFKYYLNS